METIIITNFKRFQNYHNTKITFQFSIQPSIIDHCIVQIYLLLLLEDRRPGNNQLAPQTDNMGSL